MTVIETVKYLLAKRLASSHLYEMAESRKDAEKMIRGINTPIFEHLIKVLYWEDKVNYNKHVNDLDTWLLSIEKIRLKPNSKSVKSIDIYNWLYDSPFNNGIEYLSTYIYKYLKQYHKLPRTGLSLKSLEQKLQIIYKEVSKDIEETKFISIRQYL